MKEILNKQDFENILKEGKPVMLDFYADWCGPCQALLPRVEKLADQYQDDVIIAKVNVDKNRGDIKSKLLKRIIQVPTSKY